MVKGFLLHCAWCIVQYVYSLVKLSRHECGKSGSAQVTWPLLSYLTTVVVQLAYRSCACGLIWSCDRCKSGHNLADGRIYNFENRGLLGTGFVFLFIRRALITHRLCRLRAWTWGKKIANGYAFWEGAQGEGGECAYRHSAASASRSGFVFKRCVRSIVLPRYTYILLHA